MPFTRRQFATTIGLGLLLGPWASPNRTARAAPSTTKAKRLVVVFSPNGTVHSHWRPTGSGTSFSFPSGSILEPLSAQKDKLIVCDGIDFKIPSPNHEPGMASMLTGYLDGTSSTGGMSVDQYVASVIGASTRFPSLELGVQTSAWGANVQTRMCYSAPGSYVPPCDDPVAVFDRLFDGVSTDANATSRLRARRQSILDLQFKELQAIRSRLGSAERTKIDTHVESLRQVEKGLAPVGGCEKPDSPAFLDPYNNENYPALGKAQMDLLVLALSCGMTRVASLQWSHTVADPVFNWLGIGSGHHSLSHIDDSNQQGVQDFVTCERWFAEQFSYLLSRLEETPDPEGGTLLDSTLVVWAKELGDSRMHDCTSVPFVLAGGGCFQTGRYLECGGEPHQKLLVSICQAMGLENNTFGDASKGTGPLPGLS